MHFRGFRVGLPKLSFVLFSLVDRLLLSESDLACMHHQRDTSILSHVSLITISIPVTVFIFDTYLESFSVLKVYLLARMQRIFIINRISARQNFLHIYYIILYPFLNE